MLRFNDMPVYKGRVLTADEKNLMRMLRKWAKKNGRIMAKHNYEYVPLEFPRLMCVLYKGKKCRIVRVMRIGPRKKFQIPNVQLDLVVDGNCTYRYKKFALYFR